MAVIVELCEEAEHVGAWSEQCPCHSDHTPESEVFHIQVRSRKSKLRKTMNPRGFLSEEECPYKRCRAVEFASGAAMEPLRNKMLSNRDKILAHTATSDDVSRSEVVADWHQARSRLWSGQATG